MHWRALFEHRSRLELWGTAVCVYDEASFMQLSLSLAICEMDHFELRRSISLVLQTPLGFCGGFMWQDFNEGCRRGGDSKMGLDLL